MPTDLPSFFLLLLFIAPGFLFERAYWHSLPRHYSDPNLFQQTVSAIIASTAIHFLLFLLVILIASVLSPFRNWVIALLVNPLPLSSSVTLTFNLLALTGYPILSLVAGSLGGLLWHRFFPPPVLSPWASAVAEALARGETVRLRIRLRDNEGQYVGNLAHLSRIRGKEEVSFELALNAVSLENPSNPDSKPIRVPNDTIFFLSSDILWLSRIDKPINREELD